MNENYQTQDLCLATTIQCLGTPLGGVEWVDDRRASFHFENSEELTRAIEAYWQNTLLVEPKVFFGVLKATKTRLYS